MEAPARGSAPRRGGLRGRGGRRGGVAREVLASPQRGSARADALRDAFLDAFGTFALRRGSGGRPRVPLPAHRAALRAPAARATANPGDWAPLWPIWYLVQRWGGWEAVTQRALWGTLATKLDPLGTQRASGLRKANCQGCAVALLASQRGADAAICGRDAADARSEYNPVRSEYERCVSGATRCAAALQAASSHRGFVRAGSRPTRALTPSPREPQLAAGLRAQRRQPRRAAGAGAVRARSARRGPARPPRRARPRAPRRGVRTADAGRHALRPRHAVGRRG